jgi:hypothetical protein
MTKVCKVLILIITGVLALVSEQAPILIPVTFTIWTCLVIPIALVGLLFRPQHAPERVIERIVYQHGDVSGFLRIAKEEKPPTEE